VASDQTPGAYKAYPESQLGTGVFLRVGASAESMVTFEQNINYAICIQRGQDFAAFKWIPLAIATYMDVEASRCRIVGEACSISCDAHGCLCDTNRGECVDASGNSTLPSSQGGLGSGKWADQPVFETVGTYRRR
jgi:hypothetical protein